MIKHATASVFVFREFEHGWRLGLIEHPRLKKWMVTGGHVEEDETQAEAAVRETLEESGLGVRLLPYPSPKLPVGYPHDRMLAPWWITEVLVPPDSHLPASHVHVDHQYVATVDSSMPIREPDHPFGWYSASDIERLSMFEDTRLLARMLFPEIAMVAAAAGRDDAAMLHVMLPAGS